MRSPGKLLTTYGDHESIPTLVHAFGGFVDAGAGVRQAAATIKDSCQSTVVASFDVDELLDFRARRPRMTFSSDHFSGVDIPAITVSRVVDDAGQPFLLLDGPEPDYQWNRFLAAVDLVVDAFEVTNAVGLSAIPWPAPHTRPIGITVHGNDPDLIAGRSAVLGDIEVPGHMGALLEYHLGQRGLSSIGVTAQVPHYLVQFDFPRCAMVLVEGLTDVTGLSLSGVELEAGAQKAESEVAEQLSGNEEFAAVVSALEAQYDQMSEARSALTKPSSAPQRRGAQRGRRSPRRSRSSSPVSGTTPTKRTSPRSARAGCPRLRHFAGEQVAVGDVVDAQVVIAVGRVAVSAVGEQSAGR